MGQHADGPAEVPHRVVHDTLPGMALGLHRKACAAADGRRALALPGRQRVGRVVDVRDGRHGVRLLVRPLGGRVGEVQPRRRETVARRLECDGGHAKRHAQEARHDTAEAVPGDPQLAAGVKVGDVVVHVGRRRVVQRLFNQRAADARHIALVVRTGTPTHRRPGLGHGRAAAREQEVVIVLVAPAGISAREERGAGSFQRDNHRAVVLRGKDVAAQPLLLPSKRGGLGEWRDVPISTAARSESGRVSCSMPASPCAPA